MGSEVVILALSPLGNTKSKIIGGWSAAVLRSVRNVSAVFFRTWDGPGLSRQEELGGHIPHRVVSEEELVLRHTGTQVAILQPIKRFAHSLQCRFEDVPILGKVRTDHRDRSRPISCASCSRRRYRRPRR